MENNLFNLALSLIKGIGRSKYIKLIEKFSTAENIFRLTKAELQNTIKDKNICIDILEKKTLAEAEEIIKNHQKNNVNIISLFNNEYPTRLKEIYDPPLFIYYKGKNILNNKRMLSVIGTREPTVYGLNNCKNFIKDLKGYNITIISGLAYGIDITAHKEALNNNIATISVLAGGVDIVYPYAHKPIYDKILENNGCILSEFPLGTKHDKFRFPLRNRIIAGLSDGILVIEAGEKSGTEITALCGNEYNREVFAIPGNINSNKSTGCNKMIQNNKATLVTNSIDIIKNLNWNIQNKNTLDKNRSEIVLSKDEQEVYSTIKNKNTISFDEIYDTLNLETNELSSILLKLEISNLIRSSQGDKYTSI